MGRCELLVDVLMEIHRAIVLLGGLEVEVLVRG